MAAANAAKGINALCGMGVVPDSSAPISKSFMVQGGLGMQDRDYTPARPQEES